MNTLAATQQFTSIGAAVLQGNRLDKTHFVAAMQPKPTNSESTSSAVQNEATESSNQLPAVDAVERILDQLSTGKLLSWIDGNAHEKIQAQLTEQQRQSDFKRQPMPVLSAQSMASSFGLRDSDALLNRIAQSGILSSALTVTPFAIQSQVDLNI